MSERSNVHAWKACVLYKAPAVRIRLSPPERNCTHPWNKKLGCAFFFLQDSFGLVVNFERPKIENASHLNWINQQRDEHGQWRKKKTD